MCNGSVVDLQIAPGEVNAIVSGSNLYKVAVKVAAVPKARWSSICKDCAGGIDSLVELLQGRFSHGVMERICQQRTGLFPSPAEIELACSCPDWATMCKHVAAVLYGVGARLDAQPELLFKLRQVDGKDLIATAGRALPLSKKAPARSRVLGSGGLSELFGLELGASEPEARPGKPRTSARPPKTRRRPAPAAAAETAVARKVRKKRSLPAKATTKTRANAGKLVPRTKVRKATKKRR